LKPVLAFVEEVSEESSLSFVISTEVEKSLRSVQTHLAPELFFDLFEKETSQSRSRAMSCSLCLKINRNITFGDLQITANVLIQDTALNRLEALDSAN